MADLFGEMPNKVYTYSAQPKWKAPGVFRPSTDIIPNGNDNGVFVWGNSNYPPESEHSNGMGHMGGSIGGRSTKVNTKSCVGVINMSVKSVGYAIELYPTNTGEWSSGGNMGLVGINLLRNYTRPRSDNRVVHLRDENRIETGLYWNRDVDGYYSNFVHKVEICHENSELNYEHVYITGFTFFSASGPGGGIRLPDFSNLTSSDDNNSTKSIIICRLIPFEYDYPLLTSDSNGWYCNAPSVVFNGLTEQIYHVMHDSESEVTSVSGLSQAIPEKALCSNDGIIAVSMLAKTAKGAYRLGYKNGIYKIYQGPKPLYGMPGEKVTIKGHEFVCLAYGPFYARLS